MKLYRQGDVLLKQVRCIPKDANQQKQEGGIVLAYGEVTGHKHQIADIENVDVFVSANTLYLRVNNTVELLHEEHSTIVLPPGNYERVLQVEYTPEAIRNVAD